MQRKFIIMCAKLCFFLASVQLFKILPLSSLGVGPEVSNNMSKFGGALYDMRARARLEGRGRDKWDLL